MSKTLDIPFSSWMLYYSEDRYTARITYQTKVGGKRIEQVERKTFTSRQEALDWIDNELKPNPTNKEGENQLPPKGEQ